MTPNVYQLCSLMLVLIGIGESPILCVDILQFSPPR